MTTTDCMPRLRFGFHPKRAVDVSLDAPSTSSDGGLVLLRQLDEQLGLCAGLARYLVDERDPLRTQHGRLEQLRQRVFQIVMGYEDQNDATSLRQDSAWKVACDRSVDEVDALSSQPSLSRFEHAMTARAVVELTQAFEDEYVASLPADTREIVLDLDSTEDPTPRTRRTASSRSVSSTLITTATCTSRSSCSTPRADSRASDYAPAMRATPGMRHP